MKCRGKIRSSTRERKIINNITDSKPCRTLWSPNLAVDLILLYNFLFRIGSRTNWGMSVRSDAEYEEILRDLEEKEVGPFHFILSFREARL